MTQLAPEDLVTGEDALFDLKIPLEILKPWEKKTDETDSGMVVKIRPLTIGSFSLIMKAAKNDPGLIPFLMIKVAVVEPAFTQEQIKKLNLGLVNYLITHIREVSGLTKKLTF